MTFPDARPTPARAAVMSLYALTECPQKRDCSLDAPDIEFLLHRPQESPLGDSVAEIVSYFQENRVTASDRTSASTRARLLVLEAEPHGD